MRKIKTLFQRDPEDRRFVTREVEPGCEWVLDGEGVATRKYDGTCVMFDGTDWWTRREVKVGKTDPPGFVLVQADSTTGKDVGWEPAGQSPFAKYLDEALRHEQQHGIDHPAGTYELIGPKVNGNPEQALLHALVRHDDADMYPDAPIDYDELAAWLLDRPEMEGLVWHHPDGRMVKIKRRDFVQAVRSEVPPDTSWATTECVAGDRPHWHGLKRCKSETTDLSEDAEVGILPCGCVPLCEGHHEDEQ